MGETFVPYAVSYSRRVRESFTEMVLRISDPVLLNWIFDSAKKLERRLQVYPHFGQPLRDLSIQNTTVWYGIIDPLMVQYVIDEDRRQVMVGVPFRLLPWALKPMNEEPGS